MIYQNEYKIISNANTGKFYGIYDADGIEKLWGNNIIIKGKELLDAVKDKKIAEYPAKREMKNIEKKLKKTDQQ
ncbi:MAG: hypothetical protein LBK94_07935 [Prevotellaceae bacterium]|jgi:hypothetical protein|nr:hypothetical protein [Prevotellaceae bacterium]